MNSQDLLATDERNQDSLRNLLRALSLSQGQFSLILACSNYSCLRLAIIEKLNLLSKIQFQEIVLEKKSENLYETIKKNLGEEIPKGIIVCGLELVENLEVLLKATNNARDEFRKDFPFPIVLWVTDEVETQLRRKAQDFANWVCTPIEFNLGTTPLIKLIEKTTDELFSAILAVGSGKYVDSIPSSRRREVKAALGDLQQRGVELESALAASLEFFLGQDTSLSRGESRSYYERSLQLFGEAENGKLGEKIGCVNFYLGLWWRQHAIENRADYENSCEVAKDYFQQSITQFRQSDRPDLVAKFINSLGEVLQRLEQWREVEAVATESLSLHQQYHEPIRLAHDYGLLADVALAKKNWQKAKEDIEKALSIQAEIQRQEDDDLDWVWQYNQSFFLFTLGRAWAGLGAKQAAIEKLAQARETSNPAYDPPLHIRILNLLRDGYFADGKYLKAFEIKQERLSIEQQYQLRSFVGAGRLQPPKTVVNPALVRGEEEENIADEITASGRGEDVKRLIARVGNHHTKLTVLHGQSGVGKSSLVQAGLIPAIEDKVIRNRRILPVLQQVYTDWSGDLGQCLSKALDLLHKSGERAKGKGKRDLLDSNYKSFESTKEILEQLRRNQHDFITVLIFDQFEEFFFIAKEPAQRKIFYQFLEQCLEITQVKVILSLREDYLHYLLECNERLVSLDVINNNILDKKVLYYLGNFTPLDAKSIITNLTQRSQFPLELALIDKLVEDLAEEVSEVRPIELQVVGAQLQTEKITTLEQYQAQGTKNQLVGRFLGEVVKDCGEEHEKLAWLVLYLLTDENNTRPLKTRGDLELELEVKPEQLELVLNILVKSGLVLRVPALPTERYQLVHDYLVYFVRQQQPESAKLIKELEEEREKRKLTEKQLIQTQQQKLKEARRARLTLTGLLVAVGSIAVVATLGFIESYITSLILASADNKGIDRLVSALEIAARPRLLRGILPETRRRIQMELIESIYGTREIARLEGHKGDVNSVTFSPDGKLIATVSEDKTVKIWDISGKELQTLSGHEASVSKASFSHDTKKIITFSKEDKTIRLWNIDDGKEIAKLENYENTVKSFIFSQNIQKVIIENKNNTLKAWDHKNKEIKTLINTEENITSFAISPNGQKIAIAREDQTIKVLDLEGKELKTLIGHQAEIISIVFSPDGKNIISADSKYQTILWRNYRKFSQFENHHTDSLELSLDGEKILASNKYNQYKVYDTQGNVLSYISNNEIAFSVESQRKLFFNSKNQLKIFTFRKKSNYPNIIAISEEKLDLTRKFGVFDTFNIPSNSNSVTTTLSNINRNNTKILIHKEPITNIDFSPDSTIVASASKDNAVKLWNINSENNNYSELEKNFNFNHMTFNQDDKIIPIIKDDIAKPEIKEGNRYKTFPGNGLLEFSPNRELILTGSPDYFLEISTLDGKEKILNKYKTIIPSLHLSPDSQLIVTISTDKKIHLWNRDGTYIKTLTSDIGLIKYSRGSQLVFSPDSQAIAYLDKDNSILLWDKKGNFLQKISEKTELVKSIKFSPNGSIIYAKCIDESVKLWNREGQLIKLENSNHKLESIDFSPDGKIIYRFGYPKTNQITFWNSEGSLLNTIDDYDLRNIYFSPNSRFFALVYGDGTIKTLDRYGRLIKIFANHDRVTALNISTNGQLIASASEHGTIKIWSQNGRLKHSFKKHNSPIQNIYFNSKGDHLVSLSNDGMVVLWNINSNTHTVLQDKQDQDISNIDDNMFFEENQITIHRNINNNIQRNIYPSKNNIITFIENPKNYTFNTKEISYFTIKQWNFEGREITDLKLDNQSFYLSFNNIYNANSLYNYNPYTSTNFSPDIKIISVIQKENSLKLWHENGDLLNTLQHDGKVNGASFSPNGKFIVSASDDKTVKLWDKQGYLIQTLQHDGKVNSASFSPNGKFIVSVSDDKTVKLWDKQGYLIQTLQHDDKVNGASFSPNGKLIISASDDRTVKIWNHKGELISTLQHNDQVKNASFSPNGKLIIALVQGELQIWKHRGFKYFKYVKNTKSIPAFSNMLTLTRVEHFNPSFNYFHYKPWTFSQDKKILVTTFPLKFYFIDSFWFKEKTLESFRDIHYIIFSKDNKSMATFENEKLVFISLDIDELRIKGCEQIKNYLEHNEEGRKKSKICKGVGRDK